MAIITFIIGLCGSGKSYYTEEISQTTGINVFEGVGKGIEGNSSWPIIINHLRSGEDCIIEEMDFCFQPPRDVVKNYINENVPGTFIKWICFENDLDSANWNVKKRTNKGEIENHLYINKQLHERYTYQAGAEIIAITRIIDR